MPKKMTFKVVGMTFLHEKPKGAVYPEDFHRLNRMVEERKREAVRSFPDLTDASDGVFNALAEFEEDPASWAAPMEVLAIRDPNNSHDRNAIEIHVPELGRKSLVGFVPRDLAKVMAPIMDKKKTVTSAFLDAVLVDPEHRDKPGLSITVTLS